jgi:hypothetical protein
MGTTMQREEGGSLKQSSGPAHDTLSDEQRVHLHEMPDLTKEAPEVTYGQPKRSWLRYLAVGVTVGAVAVGGGLVISTLGDADVATQFGSEYSMVREHLAQTPGGFPTIQTDGSVAVTMDYSLAREHLAQTPGGFPPVQPNGTAWSEMARSLDMEHIAQTPGGFPSAPGPMMQGNQGPVNDAPGSMMGGNEGPVNDASAA